MATRDQQISIRLPGHLLEGLDRLASERGADRSELVRQAIHDLVVGDRAGTTDTAFDRVADLVGRLSGGPPDLGRRHRHHIKRRLGLDRGRASG